VRGLKVGDALRCRETFRRGWLSRNLWLRRVAERAIPAMIGAATGALLRWYLAGFALAIVLGGL